MNAHQQQRLALLKVLYAAREAQPDQGWVAVSDLKDAVGDTAFALAYLEERGHIARSGYRCRILASGIDAVEAA